MNKKYQKVISRYKHDLFRLRNVVGVGIGIKEKNGKKTGEEVVMVLVEKKLPVQQLRSFDIVPMSLEGCKTDVLEIGDLQFLNTRSERMRPAPAGVSIGHYKVSAGTLGAIVKDSKTGVPLILSNNHVLANGTNGRDKKVKKGDPVLQPGKYDDGSNPEDVIGHLERFIPIRRGREVSGCPIASSLERLGNELLYPIRPDYEVKLYKRGAENIVDCAVAKPVSPGAIDNTILGIGKIQGIKEPEVDLKVKKSGRTSGVTSGTIKAINTTLQVKMSDNETVTFKDQFITEPMSKSGDSGAILLDENNNAVGLLFAGSEKATAYNRIKNVMEALKIQF